MSLTDRLRSRTGSDATVERSEKEVILTVETRNQYIVISDAFEIASEEGYVAIDGVAHPLDSTVEISFVPVDWASEMHTVHETPDTADSVYDLPEHWGGASKSPHGDDRIVHTIHDPNGSVRLSHLLVFHELDGEVDEVTMTPERAMGDTKIKYKVSDTGE